MGPCPKSLARCRLARPRLSLPETPTSTPEVGVPFRFYSTRRLREAEWMPADVGQLGAVGLGFTARSASLCESRLCLTPSAPRGV